MTFTPLSGASCSMRSLLRIAVIGTGLSALVALSGCAASSDAADGSAERETRTVTDIAGEVEIPADPQRIVSVDYYSPAQLVDLGITPVAVVEGFDDDDPDSRPLKYYEALRDLPTIGTYYELNIEAVLEQDPDLILAEPRFLEEGQLEQLQAIAPVVQLDASGPDEWKTRSIMIGDAVNKKAEALEQEAAFDERADAIAAEYSDVLAHPMAVLGVLPGDGTWTTYPAGHFVVPAWDSVGATFREMTAGEPTGDVGAPNAWLSLEQLGKLGNADYIVYNHNMAEAVAGLAGNAVWENLPAVQKGLVFQNYPATVTSSFEWGQSNLDDLEGLLVEIRTKLDAA
jgi:iron complex transport system substrate-binding protein